MGTEPFSQLSQLGAARSLTEVFILLRNNSMQSRHIFAEAGGVNSRGANVSDDRLSLIPLENENVALNGTRMPPEWVNVVDEVQYEMLRIRTRIKGLKDLQQRHVSRPNFSDEKSPEEDAVESSTAEITKMLMHCHRLLQMIQNGGTATTRDSQLRKNVLMSLIQSLQTLTAEFRTSQAVYLNQVKNRQANCDKFFDQFEGFDSSKMLPSFDFSIFESSEAPTNQELTMKQLQMLHENTSAAKEREREILNITKSIVEVNQLFKDLSELVVDQGTVLDRIDFNLEQTGITVKTALKSVRKADEYHRKNRKMWCIVVLSVLIIFLLILLIVIKA